MIEYSFSRNGITQTVEGLIRNTVIKNEVKIQTTDELELGWCYDVEVGNKHMILYILGKYVNDEYTALIVNFDEDDPLSERRNIQYDNNLDTVNASDIINTLKKFITNGMPFTSKDLTNYLKLNCLGWIRNREVTDILKNSSSVRELLQRGSYAMSIILCVDDNGDLVEATLYHPEDFDVDDYDSDSRAVKDITPQIILDVLNPKNTTLSDSRSISEFLKRNVKTSGVSTTDLTKMVQDAVDVLSVDSEPVKVYFAFL